MNPDETRPTITSVMMPMELVEAADWKSWVDNNQAVVVDVREPIEWAIGTLDGSILIRQGEILQRLDELPKDRPILFVCRSGNRSGVVASYLASRGYRVANMVGGVKALGMPH